MPTSFVRQHGYIALISAIIIAAILVVISVSLSITGFLSRFDVVETEYKARSSALAEGCVNQALLNLAQGINGIATGTVPIGTDSCTIISVVTAAGQITIQTKGSYQEAVTNLQVVVNDWDFSIISWQEMPTL